MGSAERPLPPSMLALSKRACTIALGLGSVLGSSRVHQVQSGVVGDPTIAGWSTTAAMWCSALRTRRYRNGKRHYQAPRKQFQLSLKRLLSGLI